MTISTNPTRFEDRLLAALEHVVSQNPAPAAAAATTAPRARPLRRLALSGAGLVAAGAAAASLMLAGGGGAAAAYAVDQQSNGTVTVTIDDIRDAAGLQAKLRAAGVPATVDYVADPSRCQAAPPAPGAAATATHSSKTLQSRSGTDSGPSTVTNGTAPPPGNPGPPAHGGTMMVSVRPDGAATFTVTPSSFEDGQHLVIAASKGDVKTLGIEMAGSADLDKLPCIGVPPAG